MAVVVLVLLCGLPGTGKTSLARELERLAATPDRRLDWCVERLSFDDLFHADSNTLASGASFEPAEWKRCQVAMAEYVCKWRAHVDETPSEQTDTRRLVLLLDDNFQLRSLRKRFARLAAEANCGFGILNVETPVEVCRERNAVRSGLERVPDHAFERMVRAFEVPDGHRHPFERNSRTLQVREGALGDAVWAALEELVNTAHALRVESKRLAGLSALDQQQRTQDQIRAARDVVHQVDLQLRKWISSAVRARPTEQQQHHHSSSLAKAALAQRLNQQRKDFLAQLSPRGAATEDSEAAGGSRGDAVNAHVQVFIQLILQEDAGAATHE